MDRIINFFEKNYEYICSLSATTKLMYFTAFGFWMIIYQQWRFFAEFGIEWTRMDSWAMFGDFFGGVAGSIVAILALMWLMLSVRIQKRELAELRIQMKLDKEIDDCRKVLELNLNQLAGVMETPVSEKTQATVYKLTNRDASTFRDMLIIAKDLTVNQNHEELNEIQERFMMEHYDDLDKLKTRIVIHARAFLDWKKHSDSIGSSIPHGVTYFVEMTSQEYDLLHYYEMIKVDRKAHTLYMKTMLSSSKI